MKSLGSKDSVLFDALVSITHTTLPQASKPASAPDHKMKPRVGSMSGVRFFRNWTPAAHSIGKRVFWTPASLRQKRGASASAKTKRGTGTTWMVGGRRLGCSPGKPTGFGEPSGNDTDQKHAQEISVLQPRGRPRNQPFRVIADRGWDSDPWC